MLKLFGLFWLFIFLIPPQPSHSLCLLESKDYVLSLESYLRKDLVSFKNVVDLDSGNSDDTTTYLGIDYHLGFKSEFKNTDARFYLKLERNGPSDYDAPLFVHNTLMNTGGVIEEYQNDELLPQLEEFWLDIPLLNIYRFKVGLYTYEVGNGFSLNGAYENYGFTIFREAKDCNWRLYYCRPDLVYKNHLGPRIRQEEEGSFDYNHNAANFFATDLKFKRHKHSFWPYLGVLADYTSPGKRSNFFTPSIKRDILGTMGFAYNLKQNELSLALELARNFGKAETSDANYKDIYHTGYLFFTSLDYDLGRVSPSIKFLLCSGNKVTLDMAQNQATTLTSGKNRAFSYGSPLNDYLSDTISATHSEIRPYVAMGSGNGLNFGVPRPRTFAISDFDNIVITSLGIKLNVTAKLSIELDNYYLRSFTHGVGTLNGQPKYLPYELGYETDITINYRCNKNILFDFSGGYFIPGNYHKELRDDTSGSLFSPFVRGDGNVDPAYQMELSVEFQF